jgi:hypothetical protein
MSLVGSLEDLGLVDILQIVSLSRKSGMLMLRSESGDGRIVLRDGLVQGAAIKGDIEDLRGLLIAQGCVDADAFEGARALATGEGIALDEALVRHCGLATDQLLALRREHVERAVMRMFGWRAGEFSFEIRDDLPEDDREMLLPSGLNTQYLAMEATRLGDEAELSGGAASASTDAGDAAEEEDDDAVMFSGESATATDPGRDAVSATDALALATAEAVDPEVEEAVRVADAAEHPVPLPPFVVGPGATVEASEPGAAGDLTDVAVEAAPKVDTRVPVSVDSTERRRATGGAVVAIDSNLSTLEWFKASVTGICSRTHIFQRRDAALVRIRQYLARGTVPIVVLADSRADRQGPDALGFTSRIRSLAPSMPILALRPESASDPLLPDVDGILLRPSRRLGLPSRSRESRVALTASLVSRPETTRTTVILPAC